MVPARKNDTLKNTNTHTTHHTHKKKRTTLTHTKQQQQQQQQTHTHTTKHMHTTGKLTNKQEACVLCSSIPKTKKEGRTSKGNPHSHTLTLTAWVNGCANAPWNSARDHSIQCSIWDGKLRRVHMGMPFSSSLGPSTYETVLCGRTTWTLPLVPSVPLQEHSRRGRTRYQHYENSGDGGGRAERSKCLQLK